MCRLYFTILLLTISIASYARNTADSMYAVAATAFNKGDYASNLHILSEILKRAEQSGNCNDIAYASMKVGGAYYHLQQRSDCMAMLRKGRQKATDCHIDSIHITCSRQIGAMLYEDKHYDSALYYLREAERLIGNRPLWGDRSALYAVLGEVYMHHIKDTAKAESYFRNSVTFATRSNDSNRKAYAHMHLGQYYVNIHQPARALVYFNKALVEYTAIKMEEGMMYAMSCKGWALGRMSKEADTLHKLVSRLITMRDSIFRAETAAKTADYRTLYEAEKKQKDIYVLARDNATKQLQIAEENRTRHILILVFISGVVILLLYLVFAYNRHKQRQKDTMRRELADLQKLRFKAVLEAEEKERVRIARELHDSLGQMLSAARKNMNAVTGIDDDDLRLMTNAKALVDDSVKEVRTISHNLMPSSLMEKGIESALEELAAKINDTGLMSIKLTMADNHERLDRSTEIAIYRIVQEVVNNMIKHSKANTVEIALSQDAEKIYLSIKDNGVGFDTAAIEHSSGIGWRNIFSRVDMMNGDVQIDSQPGKGTLVNIEFSK